MKALRRLAGRMRTESWTLPDRPGSVRRLVLQDGSAAAGHITLTLGQEAALQEAIKVVGNDLRFEHLDREVEPALWHFACLCLSEPPESALSHLMNQHAKEPLSVTCLFPVLYLRVHEEARIFDVRLIPDGHPEAPESLPTPPGDAARGGFVAVPAEGTSPSRMAARARTQAERALRLLRVALFAHRSIYSWQLRFHLGESYAFSGGGHGWKRREDSAVELGFGHELLAFAKSQPVSESFPADTTRIARDLETAIEWMDAAAFTAIPLHSLLFYFFALEALLGDKSEGLKAERLALREAMLGHLETGGFRHPSETFWLYDEVRSVAVHGGDAPDLDWRAVRSFGFWVRKAFDNFLNFAQKNGFTRRSQLLSALDEHPDNKDLFAWLAAQERPEWSRFLVARGHHPTREPPSDTPQ